MKLVPRHIRIAVLGDPGSRAVSTIVSRYLGIPYLPLDRLDTWAGSDGAWAVLRDELADTLACSRWVTVGNRDRVRELILPYATTIVWLDYGGPVAAVMALVRTLRRAVRRLVRDPAGALRAARRPMRAARVDREHRRVQYRAQLDARWVRLRSLGATRAWLHDIAR